MGTGRLEQRIKIYFEDGRTLEVRVPEFLQVTDTSDEIPVVSEIRWRFVRVVGGLEVG